MKGLASATDEITTKVRNGHHLLLTPPRCNRSLLIPRCRVFQWCDKRGGTMRYSPMAGWMAGGPSKIASSETFFFLSIAKADMVVIMPVFQIPIGSSEEEDPSEVSPTLGGRCRPECLRNVENRVPSH